MKCLICNTEFPETIELRVEGRSVTRYAAGYTAHGVLGQTFCSKGCALVASMRRTRDAFAAHMDASAP